MDLIIPQEEVIIETQKNFPDVPVFLGIGFAIFTVILIAISIKKNKK